MKNNKRQKSTSSQSAHSQQNVARKDVVKGSQQVRIIGGKWGSRRLNFPAALGLRPTIDRVRETLFNWLAFELAGKRVLDAFAGSGALGFEAASRGARTVMMLEKQTKVVAALVEHARVLDAKDQMEIHVADTLKYLQNQAVEPFDVVLLDPPFRLNMLQPAIDALMAGQWLSDNAWVYVEYEAELKDLQIPLSWLCHREKKAGQSIYALYKVNGSVEK